MVQYDINMKLGIRLALDSKDPMREVFNLIEKASKAGYKLGYEAGREAGKAEQKVVDNITKKW